mmetsp:Transcript_3082/g.3630  ORF Transcript_3082/g.3630 Transcript_3082/m.3630 type:complete len:116 (+) Transcript_3082:95-442(+)
MFSFHQTIWDQNLTLCQTRMIETSPNHCIISTILPLPSRSTAYVRVFPYSLTIDPQKKSSLDIHVAIHWAVKTRLEYSHERERSVPPKKNQSSVVESVPMEYHRSFATTTIITLL